MAEERIFVGRKDELEQFGKVLEDPKGQAVVVVGQAGMGKTWLTHKMAEVAENHPDLKCGCVRYEVTPTDSVDSTMALMMDNAFDATQVTEKSFNGTERRLEQWRSFLNVFNLGDLAMSLRRDPAKNTREQFLERLRLISKRMPENGRAVFIIDPEKYMQKESDQSWAIVVKNLPEKIKFVFAQRPGDVLVDSETVGALTNLVSIPEKRLDVLEEEAVDELLTQRIKGTKFTVTEIREALSRYEGHPYALGAALDLIEGGIKLEELPEKPAPTRFAEVQWREVSNKSEDAIRLFKAYAILEVGVPDDVVEAVSEINSNKRQHLVADKYLRGLLREEGEGLRIYHAILADYIVGQISEAEKKKYHNRAVKVYQEKLTEAEEKQTKPDALSAMRLAEHVLAAEGKEAFVYAFINECYTPLRMLGLLDVAIGLSERALNVVEKGSKGEAIALGNLCVIYQIHGELDKAEKMLIKCLYIDTKIGDEEGIASDYGNLGNIYSLRGDLDNAEEIHKKSLEIEKKLGRLNGIARQYGNLGTIYSARCELDKAEKMHLKALDIYEQLGTQKEIASMYGNLGLVYRHKGNLVRAEEMHKKALSIALKFGLLEEVSKQYGNLGSIYGVRSEFDKAESMYQKGLEIDERLDRLGGLAKKYGNLGVIYQKRGDLSEAEKMHLKALKINESMGNLEEIARNCGNLGVVYASAGYLDKAEKMYKKSLEISQEYGLGELMADQYTNLAGIYEAKGDIMKAQEYGEKAMGLFKKMGIPHRIEEVESWIDKLNIKKQKSK